MILFLKNLWSVIGILVGIIFLVVLVAVIIGVLSWVYEKWQEWRQK